MSRVPRLHDGQRYVDGEQCPRCQRWVPLLTCPIYDSPYPRQDTFREWICRACWEGMKLLEALA